MKIFDVSVDIYNGMPAFPGDPPPDIKRVMTMPTDPANVSLLCFGTHTGTHVDPPIHFVEGGYTVDQIPPDHLYGKAVVVAVPGVDAVGAKHLEGVKGDIILLKTKNSALWGSGRFHADYAYLDESAAQWLIDHHIKTIGIDYLSIGSFKGGETVHKMILGAGITAIEGLDLRKIEPGTYTLACLPLKIKDGDGAPARAFLIKDQA